MTHSKKTTYVETVYEKKLDEGFHQMASTLADILVEEEAHKPNQLLSKKAQKERFEKQLNAEMQQFKKRITSGASHIMQQLIELSHHNSEMFSDKVTDDLVKLVGLSKIIAENPADFFEQLGQNKSFLDIAHVDPSTFEKMYQAAKKLYDEKHFDASADAFGFLTILNSQNFACWMGLANSEFFQKHYEPALFAYAYSCQINPADPICHLFSSRCYEEINELENAINAIDIALFVIKGQEAHKELEPQLVREKQRLVAKHTQQ